MLAQSSKYFIVDIPDKRKILAASQMNHSAAVLLVVVLLPAVVMEARGMYPLAHMHMHMHMHELQI
jgi:hypothetical protein